MRFLSPRTPRSRATFSRSGIAACAALALALTACGGDDGGGSAAPSRTDRPSAVVGLYPYAFVLERVAGDDVQVTNLAAPGVDPHDLELTPQQIGAIVDSELAVYHPGFQPALDQAIEQNRPAHVVDIAHELDLEEAEDSHENDEKSDAHAQSDADDHADENDTHADEDHEDGDEDGHEHDGDAHVWLDPTQLSRVVSAVVEGLSEVSPADRDGFAARGASLQKELAALDEEFRAGLSSCKQKVFVTSHEAFGHLARRYGLTQIGIAGLEPDTEPSARRVAEVQRLVREHGVTTIFTERLVSPVVAETIARDLGVKTAVLDPIEGMTSEHAGQDYLSIMRANLAALQQANDCT